MSGLQCFLTLELAGCDMFVLGEAPVGLLLVSF